MTANNTTVGFTSITGTFKTMRLVGTARCTQADIGDNIYISINGGGTGAVSQVTRSISTAVTGSAFSGVLADIPGASVTAGFMGGFNYDFPAYAASIFHNWQGQSSSETSGATGLQSSTWAGAWNVASPITSFSLTCNSQFVPNSAFYLYGY